MKILVTGGCGFIGSHLVDRLLNDGHEVYVIDDLSMGKKKNLPLKNNKLKLYVGSILDTDIESLFRNIDIVFHLAALTRPQDSLRDPLKTNKVNVEGTLKVLLHAKNNKVKRLIFASSSAVYGNSPFLPFIEENDLHPVDPYAITKIAGEEYCKLFDRLEWLETNSLRFFNTYGSRQSPKGEYASVVPIFIKRIINGERPTIYGTGRQSRDFVYVEDVVDALVTASKSKTHGEVFNVGSEKSVSINKLLKIILKEMKSKLKPQFAPALKEQSKTLSDTCKAFQYLNWKAKTDIKEGIKLTLK